MVEALRGHVTDHRRFLIRLHLGQIDALERRSPIWKHAWTKYWGPFVGPPGW
jgi:hypothetical protein